jgi:cytochrome c553
MMVLRILCMAAGIWLALTAVAQSDDDRGNGKRLFAQYCASCHGAYGEVSNDVVPNILGQYPGYVLTQLAAFASNDPDSSRGGPAGDMKRSILLELSVPEFRDIAAYLESIPYEVVGASGPESKLRGDLAYQGWWLANYAGCGNCHGDDQKGLRMRDPETGELDPLVYAPFTPKLMGLKGAYIERQLINYRDGVRAGGMSAMKHSMAPLFLTPRLIQAIGKYAEGVHVVPQIEKMEATE